MKTLIFDKKNVGGKNPCYIIAEAGSNHDRNLNKAIKLIEVAAKAGADAVKFQLFTADKITVELNQGIASLEKDKFGKYGKSIYELYKKVELPTEWLPKLNNHAKKLGITFFATPFDEESADLLEQIGVPFYKISSFEITHLPLIEHIAKKNKPVILSTGMATITEINEAIKVITETGNMKYALLHCGIEYPLKMEDVNLAAMDTMKNHFSCPVGYSDHTLGITVSIAAVARGAKIIEKHFGLENSKSPDHSFSLDPQELVNMVTAIRDTEKTIGLPYKKPVKSELIYLKRGRRSIYAIKDINKGQIINEKMVAILRPAIGLKPKYYDDIIGKKAKKRINKNESLTWSKIDTKK